MVVEEGENNYWVWREIKMQELNKQKMRRVLGFRGRTFFIFVISFIPLTL